MNIEKISNGYLVKSEYGQKDAFNTIEELFEHLLLIFEGKADSFTGDSHGKVIIEYSPDPKEQ